MAVAGDRSATGEPVGAADRPGVRRAVVRDRSVPDRVEVAVRGGRRGREAVDPERGVTQRRIVRHGRDERRLAPARTAVGRLGHPDAVEGIVARGAVPEDVERPIGPDDRPRALAVQHVAGDRLRAGECRAAVRRRHEEDRRLDVGPGLRAEDVACPGDVDPVTERAADVAVDGDPLLVVEDRRRRGLVDEGRRAPAQLAAAVERAPVDRHGVRRRCAVETQTGVEHVALAVEGDRRVAARVVDPAGQASDARDQRPEVSRVAARAAPGRAAVVAEVGARIAIGEGAARRAVDVARPRPRDVVVGRGDDPVRVVRVDRDRGLVLRRGVVSWLTRTFGAAIALPSSGLVSTKSGVIGPGAEASSSPSASSSMNAEKRCWRPAVPRSDATLPASVVMSYLGVAADRRAERQGDQRPDRKQPDRAPENGSSQRHSACPPLQPGTFPENPWPGSWRPRIDFGPVGDVSATTRRATIRGVVRLRYDNHPSRASVEFRPS